MALYSGIDLHSNNHVIVVIDEEDKRLYEKRWELYTSVCKGPFSEYCQYCIISNQDTPFICLYM